jgi:hypothetical protein
MALNCSIQRMQPPQRAEHHNQAGTLNVLQQVNYSINTVSGSGAYVYTWFRPEVSWTHRLE